MRPFQALTSIAAITAGVLLAASAVTQAGARERDRDGNNHPRGTLAQRIACTPDVFSICGDDIPNIPKIVACLRKNKPRLNPDCRAVFEGRLR